jgi:phosphohistidine phosphatase
LERRKRMRLYLVQHGEAKTKDVDPERGLTNKGKSDVEKVAVFLKPLGLMVSAVWQSGKTRAAQTAEILSGSLSAAQGVVERDGLAPLDHVEPLADCVKGSGEEDLMIVGHLPFMANLASFLTAGSEASDVVAFQQGGVVCLETTNQSGWQIRWMVTPDLL